MKTRSLLLLFICSLLFSCSEISTEISGTETGNGSNGIVAFADGKPAIGAKVMLVPSDYEELNRQNQDFIIDSSLTDSLGTYSFNKLRKGNYNLFCEKDGYKSFIDSINITDTIVYIKKSILRRPGSVRGYSYYCSGNVPANSYLVVPGSRFYTRLDEKTGAFNLVDLPAGIYKAKIAASSVDYFQNQFTVQITEDKSDSISFPFVLTSKSITSIVLSSDSSLWIGTTNGLVNMTDSQWIAYGLHDGLSSSHITCIAQNIDQSIWVGTSFRLAHHEINLPEAGFDFISSTKTINVKAVNSSKQGEVWIGTGEGLYCNYKGEFQEVKYAGSSQGLLIGNSNNNQLTDISVIQFQNSKTLVGTHHGLFIRDSAGVWNSVADFTSMSVNAVEIIDSNSYLAGTNSGLYKCTGEKIEKIEFSESLPISSITCILCYEGKWFLGTENGLFENVSGSWSEIDIRPLNSFVTAISHDNKKTVWIGTNNGLCMYYENNITILK
jgi:hypothetical protein